MTNLHRITSGEYYIQIYTLPTYIQGYTAGRVTYSFTVNPPFSPMQIVNIGVDGIKSRGLDYSLPLKLTLI